jgi:uncharacterized protein
MLALDAHTLFTKYLRSLERWIEKAQAHAKERGFDAEVLAAARLAPDQFAFTRQIQAACDAAKFAAARLAGKEPPSQPDTEKTIDELKERIRTTLAYLETFSPDDFAGSDDRQCTQRAFQGKWLRGADYALHFSVPNFLFHVVTAYSILRHNGVVLGKMDFLAPMPLQG